MKVHWVYAHSIACLVSKCDAFLCLLMHQDAVRVRNEGQMNRDHVLMLPNTLDITPNGMWPPPGGLALGPATSLIGTAPASTISCGYAHSLLLLPPDAASSHLQVHQLRLAALPQGQMGQRRQHRLLLSHSAGGNPPTEYTLLLWFIKRCVLHVEHNRNGIAMLDGILSPWVVLSCKVKDGGVHLNCLVMTLRANLEELQGFY
jgi:hypothetical protein